MSLMIN